MNLLFILVTRKYNIKNKLIQTSSCASCLYCCEIHFLNLREAHVLHVIEAFISKYSCLMLMELEKEYLSAYEQICVWRERERETKDIVTNSIMIILFCYVCYPN
jgi:hypothetical protein